MNGSDSEQQTADRPRIAVTLGDVAGAGPEVVVRALLDDAVQRTTRPVIVGHPEVVRRAIQLVGAERQVVVRTEPDDADPVDEDAIECWFVGPDEAADVPAATVDTRSGRAAYEYLTAAIRATDAGHFDAITTAPLNKLALRQAGYTVPGHTEILAGYFGIREHAMMLHLPPDASLPQPFGLSVAHVTLHTSIASVPGLLSQQSIEETIQLIDRFVKGLGCDRPRIGVCALNPHAGESGLFGDEEQRLIAPAVQQQRHVGCDADGPYPADTLFKRAALDGEFDGIVAMYHDQGHIAFKLLGFDRAVNVTLGLPIIRTSPSQGTAFDIAWQGRARPDGMIAALLTAARLVKARQRDRG